VDNKIQIEYESVEDIAHQVGKMMDRVDALLTKARLCISMMDDGVWIGRGSDKYRNEMENLTIPSLRKLSGALSDMRYGFLRAGDILHAAEQEAAHRINHLPELVVPVGDAVGNGVGGGFSGGGFVNSGGDFRPGIGSVNAPGVSVFGAPDPRIPDIFPVGNGSGGQTIPRPDWYTEYSEDIDGFNGAVNGTVLLIDGGGSQTDHGANIVGESQAGGGVPVSGMLVPPNISDSRQAERAASAVGGFLASNPNAQVKLSPGLQALINGVATDSLGRSLMNMPSQAQLDAMRRFVEILRTTVEAFGRVIPGL